MNAGPTAYIITLELPPGTFAALVSKAGDIPPNEYVAAIVEALVADDAS